MPAELPQEIEIQGDGGLLALGGERKLSIRSRGVAVIKFEIDRVLSTQINHLVSQTEGEFQAPEFKNGSFDQDNISRIAREDQTIALQNKWKANYSAFDFAKYLQKPADGGSERGLFFLKARGWDPVAKQIHSWVFDSDGGFGEGTWTHKGSKWLIQSTATLPDGGKATSLNIVTRLKDNSFTWDSVNREIDGELQPNGDPVVVVRKSAQ